MDTKILKPVSWAGIAALVALLIAPAIFGVERANAQAVTGSLTVVKNVIGGDADIADFDLFLNGLPIENGVATTSLSVGTYTVTEVGGPAGYTATFSQDCNASGVVTVTSAGGDLTCEITNTFTGTTTATSTLTVNKVVIGGPATNANFTLFVNGVPITSGVATTTLAANTYTITESPNLAGYVRTFSGACNAAGQVVLTEGANLTCTVTNTYNPTLGTAIPGQTFYPPATVVPLGAQVAQGTPGLPTTGGSDPANILIITLGTLLAISGIGLVFSPAKEQ